MTQRVWYTSAPDGPAYGPAPLADGTPTQWRPWAPADTTGIGTEEPLPLPPVRGLITLALPGVASLALFASYILLSDGYRLGINTVVPLVDWGIPASRPPLS
jgi:hypothetical protein